MTIRTRRILLWSHYLLFVAGLSTLAYCVIVTMEGRHYQAWAREQLQKCSSDLNTFAAPSNPSESLTHAALPGSRGIALVGRVDVPRIHLSAMIAEGSTTPVLDLAVGHVPGTALPGETGNTALAAHRDTFFRRLGELEPGDLIRISDPRAVYNYRVTFTDIVNPYETWVLQSASGATLTLITCYPFHFVGAAPKRFVVRARRVDPNWGLVPLVSATHSRPFLGV
jgi:sortase A